jgi:hypothetical protein
MLISELVPLKLTLPDPLVLTVGLPVVDAAAA